MTRAIVVMGVSGCGKTTLAEALAAALGWSFIEGDSLHPPANIAKMAAGIPLTDEDRRPFLLAVATSLASAASGAVASCSALKRSYRDLIRTEADPLFVLPMLSYEQLKARMTTRPGHFMPVSLLDSQLATLEPPAPDERAMEVDGLASVADQVDAVTRRLAAARHGEGEAR